MDITIWDFVRSLVLNFLEFSMVYIVVNNIIDFKFKETTYKKKIKIIGVGLFHSVVATTLGILLVVGYLQMTASLGMVFWSIWMILKLNKKKKPRIDHTILTFLIVQLVGQITIGILLTIVSFLSFNEDITHLLTFLSGLIAVSVVCLKVDFNKLFIYVARKVFMKLVLFVLLFVFIVTLAIFGFDPVYLVEHIILYLMLTMIALLGLTHVIREAYQYTNMIRDDHHDFKNMLMILQVNTSAAISLEGLKQVNQEMIDLIAIKPLKKFDVVADNHFERLILQTIEQLKINKASSANVMIHFDYYEKRRGITDVAITYIVTSLVENAIETLTKKPIYVSLFISEHQLFIKVENEFSLNVRDLEKIMRRGYSKKEGIGRGIGLAKLKKKVERYGGTLTPTQGIHEKEQVNYLTMTIHI